MTTRVQIWANQFLIRESWLNPVQILTRMLLNPSWVRLEQARREDLTTTKAVTWWWLARLWTLSKLHIKAQIWMYSCNNKSTTNSQTRCKPINHQALAICNLCKFQGLDTWKFKTQTKIKIMVMLAQEWTPNNTTIICKVKLVRIKFHLPLKIWYNNSNINNNKIKNNRLKKFLR